MTQHEQQNPIAAKQPVKDQEGHQTATPKSSRIHSRIPVHRRRMVERARRNLSKKHDLPISKADIQGLVQELLENASYLKGPWLLEHKEGRFNLLTNLSEPRPDLPGIAEPQPDLADSRSAIDRLLTARKEEPSSPPVSPRQAIPARLLEALVNVERTVQGLRDDLASSASDRQAEHRVRVQFESQLIDRVNGLLRLQMGAMKLLVALTGNATPTKQQAKEADAIFRGLWTSRSPDPPDGHEICVVEGCPNTPAPRPDGRPIRWKSTYRPCHFHRPELPGLEPA